MRSLLFLALLFIVQSATAGWKLDFSRRRAEIKEREKWQSHSYKNRKMNKRSVRGIASLDEQYTTVPKKEEAAFLENILDRQAPAQEIVIMHTNDGFFPKNMQIYKNRRYKVHVVNVADSNKNVSFMLDSFSQHHGTYFGKPVSFTVEPRQEGLFPFQCPETGAKGNLVVTHSSEPIPSPLKGLKERKPTASRFLDVKK